MTDRPDIHTLTGAYAVDALPDDEREIFEHHLIVCDACAQEVAELQATAARLGAASFEAPPPGLRSRVMAEIDSTRQERPHGTSDAVGDEPADEPDYEPGDELGARRADAARSNRARSGWLTNVSVAAAAVLVVAVAGLSVTIANLNDRIAQVETASSQVTDVLAAADATMVSVEGPSGGVGRVVASPTRGEAVFLADQMEGAPEEHTYELWLIDEEGASPAGLFQPDDRGRATRVMTGDIANAVAIGVTVEPAGGSPVPTSEPVMVFELG
jgi:anti-sigma-K factor RskA